MRLTNANGNQVKIFALCHRFPEDLLLQSHQKRVKIATDRKGRILYPGRKKYSVPNICLPLCDQPISSVTETFEYLKNINFADTGKGALEVAY